MITISVIIPTLNSEKTLPLLFNSLEKQVFRDFEVIVVDGFSSDRTTEIAKSFGAKVYLVHGERSTQKNYGAKRARGKYLYFVDSDFYLHPNVLEECMDIASKGYDAVIVLNISDPRPSIVAKVRFFERLSYYMSYVYEAARFIKKDLFFKVGGFSEDIYANEDYDLHLKLLRIGAKIGHTHRSFEIHLGEPGSLKEFTLKSLYYGKNIGGYFKKNPVIGHISPIRSTYFKKEFVAYAFRKWKCSIPLIILLKIIQSISMFIGMLGVAKIHISKVYENL